MNVKTPEEDIVISFPEMLSKSSPSTSEAETIQWLFGFQQH